jgi:hypothetical protein
MANVLDAVHKLARAVFALAKGPAVAALADMEKLDPDNARGVLIGFGASMAVSNAGTDVDFRTNPDFDLAIHGFRGMTEVGTTDATGLVGNFSNAHASVQLKDVDRSYKIIDGTSPAVGGNGGIDMGLLPGSQGGDALMLPVPYVFKGQKGASTLRATFYTDGSWPSTKRVGLLCIGSYRRRSFRQFEAA